MNQHVWSPVRGQEGRAGTGRAPPQGLPGAGHGRASAGRPVGGGAGRGQGPPGAAPPAAAKPASSDVSQLRALLPRAPGAPPAPGRADPRPGRWLGRRGGRRGGVTAPAGARPPGCRPPALPALIGYSVDGGFPPLPAAGVMKAGSAALESLPTSS